MIQVSSRNLQNSLTLRFLYSCKATVKQLIFVQFCVRVVQYTEDTKMLQAIDGKILNMRTK